MFALHSIDHMENFTKDEQKSTCTMNMPEIRILKLFYFLTTLNGDWTPISKETLSMWNNSLAPTT